MPSPQTPDDTWLAAMAAAALEAGQVAYRIYQGGFEVREKADRSPVTEADEAAEALILDRLTRLAPDVPVVAEESAAAGRIPAVDGQFFLVDPLDGTKEFIARNGEFTVNIALIRSGAPVLGVVHAPVSATLYTGDVAAHRATRTERAGTPQQSAPQPIHVRPVPETGLTAVVSRSHATPETQAYLARYNVAERVSIGSSLKLCLVAAGQADLYPRIGGPTMEWDTAAGHAVLLAAGGAVRGPGNVPLRYGKPGFRNPTSFVATGPLDPFPV